MDIAIEYQGAYTSITDGTIAVLHEIDGLGKADGHGIFSRGSMQHGESLVDYRLDPRVFNLALGVKGPDLAALEVKRAQLWQLLRWQSSPFVVRITTDSGAVRHIDAGLSARVEGRLTAALRTYQRLGVQLRAPDPTLYDPTLGVQTFALGGGSVGFEVPTDVPTAIGASTIDQTHNVEYAGTAASYPIIRVVGPIEDCIITNNTTGKVISFDGATIAALDYYDIDCRYDYQTVTDAAGVSQIADLTDGSDLGTFRLEPAPIALNGTNVINVSGSNITNATSVVFTWYVRYDGI